MFNRFSKLQELSLFSLVISYYVHLSKKLLAIVVTWCIKIHIKTCYLSYEKTRYTMNLLLSKISYLVSGGQWFEIFSMRIKLSIQFKKLYKVA